jgi:renalase
MKTVIVGAGLSGLLLAEKLNPVRDVAVFDKARGVGGRLATRRTDTSKFDHGAQFYRLKGPIRELHERWFQQGLVHLWFEENGEQHYCATSGMTALAKDLAQNTNVILSERIATIHREGEKWNIKFESGRSESTDEIVFTCPVPQALEILKSSSLPYPSRLDDVTYTKALVLLIENSPVPFQFSSHGYVEPKGSSVFSVADQHEKRISKTPALTITFNADFSEANFESPEHETIEQALTELKKLSPGFEPGETQLKKWRYCQVQKSFGELYVKVSDGVYLAGDGFGGASLNGAARSATALAVHLNHQKR